jgi:hypothetical protein
MKEIPLTLDPTAPELRLGIGQLGIDSGRLRYTGFSDLSGKLCTNTGRVVGETPRQHLSQTEAPAKPAEVRAAIPIDPLNHPVNGLSCTMGLSKGGFRLPGEGVENKYAPYSDVSSSFQKEDTGERHANGEKIQTYRDRRGIIATTSVENKSLAPLQGEPMRMMVGNGSNFAGPRDTGIKHGHYESRKVLSSRGRRATQRAWIPGETGALSGGKALENMGDTVGCAIRMDYLSGISPEMAKIYRRAEDLKSQELRARTVEARRQAINEGKAWWKAHGKLAVFDPNAPADPNAPLGADGQPVKGRAIVCQLIDWGPHGTKTNKSIDLTTGAIRGLGHCVTKTDRRGKAHTLSKDEYESCAANLELPNLMFSFATDNAPIGSMTAKSADPKKSDCSQDLQAMRQSYNEWEGASAHYPMNIADHLGQLASKTLNTVRKYLPDPFAEIVEAVDEN